MTDCSRVTMRAVACESSVALNPEPAVQHPNHRYVPSLLYSRDYNICCCQRQDYIAFPLPFSFFRSACTLHPAPCTLHSALCRTSRDVAECRQSLCISMSKWATLSLTILPWCRKGQSSPFYFNMALISSIMMENKSWVFFLQLNLTLQCLPVLHLYWCDKKRQLPLKAKEENICKQKERCFHFLTPNAYLSCNHIITSGLLFSEIFFLCTEFWFDSFLYLYKKHVKGEIRLQNGKI